MTPPLALTVQPVLLVVQRLEVRPLVALKRVAPLLEALLAHLKGEAPIRALVPLTSFQQAIESRLSRPRLLTPTVLYRAGMTASYNFLRRPFSSCWLPLLPMPPSPSPMQPHLLRWILPFVNSPSSGMKSPRPGFLCSGAVLTGDLPPSS